VSIFGVEDVEDLFETDVVSFKLAGVDVDVDFARLGPKDADVGNVVEPLQFIFNDVPGDFADLAAGADIGGQGEVHDGLGGDVEALDRRLVDLVGQAPPDGGDFLAHLVGHHLGVRAEGELQRGLRKAFQRD
jgi:hypothetical protein